MPPDEPSPAAPAAAPDSQAPEPVRFVLSGQGWTAPDPPARAAGSTGRAPSSNAVGADDSGVPGGVTRASVRLGAARDGGVVHRVSARPGQDIVVLHLANGPTLWLHPEHARELMAVQPGASSRAAEGSGGTAASDDEMAAADIAVPADLLWPLPAGAASRSGVGAGRVALRGFDLVSLAASAVSAPAAAVAAAVAARIDAQVDPGVYALQPDRLLPLKDSGGPLAQVPASDQPLLIWLHGTFVDTASTFGTLWLQHPAAVQALFAHYGGRVYALDHPTLGQSPLDNALQLVRALPAGARLHLATHSRGGLVAEVLARVCDTPVLQPQDLSPFDDPALAAQRAVLLALQAQARAKSLRVERVLRVACPARGTLLASRRLDIYLSVLRWALETAGVRLLPTVLAAVAEVARCRADPALLPGLQAMMPDSALVQWLNDGRRVVGGDLRVIAGDLQGDSVGSWLKALAADAFFWTDHDLVVHTRAMYGGAPRHGGALALLDRGGRVDHFRYFVNARSVDALVAGLTQAQPEGFAPIGPLSAAGQDGSGWRGGDRPGMPPPSDRPGMPPPSDRPRAQPPSDRPAVLLLPGFGGSHLADAEGRVWLGPRLAGGLMRLRAGPQASEALQPQAPVGAVYGALMRHLQITHAVLPLAYDWRAPLQREAERLALALDAALAARQTSGQPVRLLAHGLGGLLVRVLQLQHPDLFERWMAHPGARLLMLSTPNAGCWLPLQLLSGDDDFGHLLGSLGPLQAQAQARQWLAEMPGLLQAQAGLTDAALGLHDAATWRRLAAGDAQAARRLGAWQRPGDAFPLQTQAWGLPPQPLLDAARALRQQLDAQAAQVWPRYAHRCSLVVGQAARTPDGMALTADGLVYTECVDAGDGRVTWAQARLPGVPTWLLRAGHGELPSTPAAFAVYTELLQTGRTERLPPLPEIQPEILPDTTPDRQAAPATVPPARSRLARQADVYTGPPTGSAAVLATPRAPRAPEPGSSGGTVPALRLQVLHGNLSAVDAPLMLGHYHADALSGTEAVVDLRLGGSLSAALNAGLYPDRVGTQQVYVNRRRPPLDPGQAPSPSVVIIVGLGDEGRLREADIVCSVRLGTLAWVQQAAGAVTPAPSRGPADGGAGGAGGPPPRLTLTATLLGSGGMGISPAAAAEALARGVHEANQRLQADGWPTVQQLTLVELYGDRATEAWLGLQRLAACAPQAYTLPGPVRMGTAGLARRLEGGYRGVDYELVRVSASSEPGSLNWTLDTRRARTELRAHHTQVPLLRELVARAAQDGPDDARLGRTLFQLLVPVALEAPLGTAGRIVLELEPATAAIPWEMLEPPGSDDAVDPRPWALRARLLRRLHLQAFRAQPRDARAEDAVLLIGDPQVDPGRYAPLPGAAAEAAAVRQRLLGPGGVHPERVRALVAGASALEVVQALLERPYRIVHIAGHGELPVAGRHGGGVVLSDGHFLGPNELGSLRTVPELVVVNCCHLGALPGRAALQTGALPGAPGADAPASSPAALAGSAPGFAAGVAESLIALGVRCVVAAGWAVQDVAAERFADAFYRALLAGERFIGAVSAGREAAWRAEADRGGGRTWAAYQCYGDPDWRLRARTGDAQAAVARPEALQPLPSTAALALALDDLRIRLRSGSADAASARLTLLRLQAGLGAVKAPAGSAVKAPAGSAVEAPAGGAAAAPGGVIAEAFARAWIAADDLAAALTWAERALYAPDGAASLRTLLLVPVLRVILAGRSTGDAVLAPALYAVLAAARQRCEHGGSVAAWSWLGWVQQRRGQLAWQQGDTAAARSALRQARAAYAQAEALDDAANRFSPREDPGAPGDAGDPSGHLPADDDTGLDPTALAPALRRLALDLWLAGPLKPSRRQRAASPAAASVRRSVAKAWDADAIQALRTRLRHRACGAPEFIAATALLELDVIAAIAAHQLAAQAPALTERCLALRSHLGARPTELLLQPLGFVLGAAAAAAQPQESQAALRLMERLTESRTERLIGRPEAKPPLSPAPT